MFMFGVFLVRIFQTKYGNLYSKVNLSIQSEYGKKWTRKTRNTDTFNAEFTKSSFIYYLIHLTRFCISMNMGVLRCFVLFLMSRKQCNS